MKLSTNNDVQIFVPSKNRLITIWKFREFLHLWSRNFDLPILVSSRCEGHLQQFPGVGVVVDDLSGPQKLGGFNGDDHPSLPWSEPRAKEVMVLAETRWKVGDHLDLSPEIIPLSLHMSPCQRCWWVWWWSSHSRRQRLPRHQSCGGWWVFQHKSQWIRFVGNIFSFFPLSFCQ